MSGPLCRYCAKPIAKETITVYFVERELNEHDLTNNRMSRFMQYRSVPSYPTTKAEAQRHVNGTVVSVRKGWRDGEVGKITRCSTGDGESYVDQFFCNGGHAAAFGYAAARSGHAMKVYNEAMKARQE